MLAQKTIISPSILAADFAYLGKEAQAVTTAGADWLHIDVMDNHYVPNLSFGAPVAKALARVSTLPLDVHLMVEQVDTYIAPFAALGAARLTFHPDSTTHTHRTISAIKAAGMSVGIALNPVMPLSCLDYVLELDGVDLILLMTVNPGFGGQTFIEEVLPKITAARKRIEASGRAIYLQVDGGINADTARRCRDAGADALVAGNYIFTSKNYADAITSLRN